MTLTQDQEDHEYEPRIEQMSGNIAQMRANEEKLRTEIRFETRKFMVRLVVGAAALLGAGAAAGSYLSPRSSPGQTIIVNVPPYSPTTAPPAKP